MEKLQAHADAQVTRRTQKDTKPMLQNRFEWHFQTQFRWTSFFRGFYNFDTNMTIPLRGTLFFK